MLSSNTGTTWIIVSCASYHLARAAAWASARVAFSEKSMGQRICLNTITALLLPVQCCVREHPVPARKCPRAIPTDVWPAAQTTVTPVFGNRRARSATASRRAASAVGRCACLRVRHANQVQSGVADDVGKARARGRVNGVVDD